MTKLITILFICLLPFFSEAQTTYYVSWSGGNDANNGTSTATPWKTLRKAETTTINPGDKILFKRGDTWNFENEVSYFDGFDVLSSGTAGNYITYGAYGTGARPIFTDKQDVPGWTVSSNWISRGGNRWAIYISGLQPITSNYRCRVWINGVEQGMPDPASATPTAVTSTRTFALATDSLYIYSTSNPATVFSSMQKSNGVKKQGFKVNSKSYVRISNLNVATTATSSFVITGASNIIIDSCIAGYDGLFSSIIVSGSNTGVISNTMVNSNYKINNQFLFNGTEDGISVEQGTSNWNIYKDTMMNLSHSGFGFDFTTSDIISNNSVHDCYISARDIAYGRGFSYNANAGSFGNKIYNNYIVSTPTCSQISGPGVDVYNNVIDSVTKPAYRPSTDRAGAGLAIISYNNTEIRNVNIFNNTIANCQNMAFDIEGRLTDSIVDVKIINNILHNNATGGQETNPYQIYLLDHNYITKRLTIRNNILYKPGETILVFYSPNDINDTWPKTVAQFNATDGDYENVINGNLNVDPLFISTTDFHLQSGSPAIEAGVDVGLPFTGSAPDIGAYAYSTSVAAPTMTLSGDQNLVDTTATSVYAVPVWAPGHGGSVVWSKVSGGTIAFGSSTSTSTTVSNLQEGTYAIKCDATQDDGQKVSKTMYITVSFTQQQPYIQFKMTFKKPKHFYNVNL